MSDDFRIPTKNEIREAIDKAHDAEIKALRDELARVRSELEVDRQCRLANEAEMHRADKLIGELRTKLAAAVAERDKWKSRAASLIAFVPEGVLCGDLQKAAEECAALLAELASAAIVSAHDASLPEPKEQTGVDG